MQYSRIVIHDDVKEAVRLMRVATQAAATDPRMERIAKCMIATGRSTSNREMEESLNLSLKELLAEVSEKSNYIIRLHTCIISMIACSTFYFGIVAPFLILVSFLFVSSVCLLATWEFFGRDVNYNAFMQNISTSW